MIIDQPNTPFLVCGDFNMDSNPLPFLYDLTDGIQFTFQKKKLQEKKQARLDFV